MRFQIMPEDLIKMIKEPALPYEQMNQKPVLMIPPHDFGQLFFKRISFVVNITQKFIFIQPVGTGGNVLGFVAFQLCGE